MQTIPKPNAGPADEDGPHRVKRVGRLSLEEYAKHSQESSVQSLITRSRRTWYQNYHADPADSRVRDGT